ncbi:barstar family protein [Gynurincola endophyticus]|jgi:RNAse (barnase) inhibitor barstar|uniref:barstar family protein n=1 Tax=Gynurincola endophyticus TaxID=2479004 RepID=UPI000F8F3F53|nr:barstar family protein [Gynurincola endophyticus]
MKTLTIEGKNIHDIASFYEEINRVFMFNEDWQIGQSLDAFNDLLHGGFGEVPLNKPVQLVWKDIAISKEALGYNATKAYYLNKLQPGSSFNQEYFKQKLAQLENGEGQTYFDIVKEIIDEHIRIQLTGI